MIWQCHLWASDPEGCKKAVVDSKLRSTVASVLIPASRLLSCLGYCPDLSVMECDLRVLRLGNNQLFPTQVVFGNCALS